MMQCRLVQASPENRGCGISADYPRTRSRLPDDAVVGLPETGSCLAPWVASDAVDGLRRDRSSHRKDLHQTDDL